MDTSKVTDTYNQAKGFIDTCVEIQNKYINKINGLLEQLENVINNASYHSDYYVKTKTADINKKINDNIEGFRKNIDEKMADINAWYDEQVNNVKENIAYSSLLKLGVDISQDMLSGIVESIPHPKLSIPDFKIEVPEFDPNIHKTISIPRIPTV